MKKLRFGGRGQAQGHQGSKQWSKINSQELKASKDFSEGAMRARTSKLMLHLHSLAVIVSPSGQAM